MSSNNIDNKIQFKIDHIDPLGQGVSKEDGNIVFIKRTLPGESGTAEVYRRKKNIAFAHVTNIESKSENRIEPECKYYEFCNGCTFQHTDYNSEISFKLATLARAFRVEESEIDLHQAPKNLGYRNRIQFHYNKDENLFGFKDETGKNINPIENCILATPPIQEKIKTLAGGKWKNLVVSKGGKGHIELYETNGKVKITANEPYSSGGFTQVNQEMNTVLKNILSEHMKEANPNSILDLFAGDGNLTKDFDCEDKNYIDSYPHATEDDFYSLNLFKPLSLETYKKKSLKIHFDLMMIDPPRAGFKNISDWVSEFTPQDIIYVSCNHQTLKRDIDNLEGYSLKKLYLVDLFPSTYHFETIAILTKE
jgi:23S rRNA (uracil1939-C5)-methyltransferase